ncbi:hypothetical protein AD935_06580 [Gluconobacter japonicus]|nr:hypothetical protein AD935_06580 [Gluconobacter japonicus]
MKCYKLYRKDENGCTIEILSAFDVLAIIKELLDAQIPLNSVTQKKDHLHVKGNDDLMTILGLQRDSRIIVQVCTC